jgi:L-fuconolactonase
MRIDAHQHFWRYTAEEYGWIDGRMAAIRRDFLPADVEAEMRGAGIDRAISVQARQSIEETEWMLQLAATNNWIAGVVGWVPLVEPAVAAALDRLAADPNLKGVRHPLQAEPCNYLEREDFARGLKQVAQVRLAYDLLIFHHQLPAAIRLVDRHPRLTIVLDHIAKPAIAQNALEPWRSNLRDLARRPNVFCKISGLVTEADYPHWTETQLQPYLEVALEAFGPERLMFGSDWPVASVAIGFANWLELVNRFMDRLSISEKENVFSGSARRAYRLGEG